MYNNPKRFTRSIKKIDQIETEINGAKYNYLVKAPVTDEGEREINADELVVIKRSSYTVINYTPHTIQV